MTTFHEKRRTRRIASDEAHAWARSLRLNNPYANSVLRAVALYVDGEACCFTSIEQLAEDTNLSMDTVRKRLSWLEQVGAIVRFAQWLDQNGHRNGEGRGKRTTDIIKLLTETDCDAIERRAAGDIVGENDANSTTISPSHQRGLNSEGDEISPRCQQGLNCDQPSVSPRLALAVQRGPDSFNHEPESLTPNPFPDGKGGEDIEPDDFKGFFESCQHWRTMSRERALIAFRAIGPDDQKLARAASRLHAAECDKAKRKSLDAHKLIAERFWILYPHAKAVVERPPDRPRREIVGDELDGLRVAVRMGEQCELITTRPITTVKTELQLDMSALAEFVDQKRDDWPIVERGSREFAAWRARLKFWLGIEPRPERIWLEAFDPAVHDPKLIGSTQFRLRKSADGFRVPKIWPPRRDGSWSTDNGEAA